MLVSGETEYNNFFFNDTATTEIYTLSLHDALPISSMAEQFNASSSSSRVSFVYIQNLGLRQQFALSMGDE